MQEATRGGPWVIPEFLGVCRVLAREADGLSHFLVTFLAWAPRAEILHACSADLQATPCHDPNGITQRSIARKKTANPKVGGLIFNGNWLTPASH
jgi:hypothetical protein